MTEAFLFDKVLRFDVRGKAYLKTLNKYYKAGSKTAIVKIMVKNKTWIPERGHWE